MVSCYICHVSSNFGYRVSSTDLKKKVGLFKTFTQAVMKMIQLTLTVFNQGKLSKVIFVLSY